MSTDEEQRLIAQRCREIDKARREEQQRLMREYDDTIYRPARIALIDACEALGHGWTFSTLNPVGYPVFRCRLCGISKIEPND